jgi:DNA-binding NarL/FixJ family response regulator
MSAVRVGILSETRLFVEGLSRIVGAEADLRFVDVGDEDALMAAAPSARPQILLLDGRMDRALAACQRCATVGDLKILVLAVPEGGTLAADVLLSGARGILHQGAPTKHVAQAIALVQQGKIWAPRHVVAAAWKKCMPDADADVGPRIAGWQSLSAREREVLRHAAAGCANKELADRLAISEATVKVHLTHIFRKVGCRSRSELAAAYHGIIPLDARTRDAGPPISVRRSAN